jgi:hypothetical protein
MLAGRGAAPDAGFLPPGPLGLLRLLVGDRGGLLVIQALLGVLQPGQPLGPPPQPHRQLVAAVGAVLGVLRLIGGGVLGEQLGGQRIEAGLLLGHLMSQRRRGVVGRPGRIRRDLGPIDGDHPQAHHPGLMAQPQHLREQTPQRLPVPDEEPGDGGVIGHLVAGQYPECHIADAVPLDRPRRAHPHRVRVHQHRDHHRRIKRRRALTVGTIRAIEGRQVEGLHDVLHRPHQLALGQPLPHIRRQQEPLIDIPAQEVLRHATVSRAHRSPPGRLALYATGSIVRRDPARHRPDTGPAPAPLVLHDQPS